MTEEQYKKANDIMPRIESLKCAIERLEFIKRCIEEGEESDMTIRARVFKGRGADYMTAIDDKYKLMIINTLYGDHVARLEKLKKEFERL